MNALIIVAIILIIYWKIRNQFYSRLLLEYKHKMYDLRDVLREFAIEGKIDKNDWRFKYLDSSISKTVGEMDKLNLYTLFTLYHFHKRDKEMKKRQISFTKSLKENNYLYAVFQQYAGIITIYIIQKHFILSSTAMFLVRTFDWLERFKPFEKIKKSFKKAVQSLRFAPETSTGQEYAI